MTTSNEFDHQLIFMNYDIVGSIVFFVVRFSGCLWRNENMRSPFFRGPVVSDDDAVLIHSVK